jgi:hypothetical protein
VRYADELREKHGTPAEFARAVWGALGEVSVAEAEAAIAKYEQEWSEAERKDRNGI